MSQDPAVPAVTWEIEITHDGAWPTTWRWRVCRSQANPSDFSSRGGETFTKDRARRKALKAKRSMDEDDVTVTYA